MNTRMLNIILNNITLNIIFTRIKTVENAFVIILKSIIILKQEKCFI